MIKALEQRGYALTAESPFMSCLGRSLADLPAVPHLPAGYSIRTQRDHADVVGRAAAHRDAFDSIRITTERLARMRDTWPYRSELDLIVASPADDVVAYCQGWYDETNGIGAFEPVGTHPATADAAWPKPSAPQPCTPSPKPAATAPSSTHEATPPIPSPSGSTSPWASASTPARIPTSDSRWIEETTPCPADQNNRDPMTSPITTPALRSAPEGLPPPTTNVMRQKT
ncbi:hypothetical protein AOB60_23675 [Streptomyces noursei]|uniref:Uncharacterized protein n=1 Tax=Streptomyces noursei TaxID=1971 RepID=A0A2N8P8J4_STRNR|nr:hypothetical protein AOB60_23675 [Streptomyces noursei]